MIYVSSLSLCLNSLLLPFTGHYTGQPALAGSLAPLAKKIMLEQSFTACMPLLTETSTVGLGRRN